MKTRVTNFIRSYLGSNDGAAALLVAASATVLFGMLALSTDVGYLALVRNQLQNAADAGALAGVTKTGFLLAGASGSPLEARTLAVNYVTAHIAADRQLQSSDIDVFVSFGGSAWEINEFGEIFSADLSSVSSDVAYTFLSYSPDMPAMLVVVKRTEETSPVTLFLAQLLGHPQAGVKAEAVARLAPIAGTCKLMPWMVRDKPFVAPDDIGVRVVLKTNWPPQDAETPGWFRPVDFPPRNRPECGSPVTGGSAYRDNIINGSSCDCQVMIGDILQTETGNKVGPTVQGVRDRIAMDPDAWFDTSTNTIQGSIHDDWRESERVVNLALFGPDVVVYHGIPELEVVKFVPFFIESAEKVGNSEARIYGYFPGITTMGGTVGGPGTPSLVMTPQLLR